jgi:hypothetical protein
MGAKRERYHAGNNLLRIRKSLFEIYDLSRDNEGKGWSKRIVEIYLRISSGMSCMNGVERWDEYAISSSEVDVQDHVRSTRIIQSAPGSSRRASIIAVGPSFEIQNEQNSYPRFTDCRKCGRACIHGKRVDRFGVHLVGFEWALSTSEDFDNLVLGSSSAAHLSFVPLQIVP